MSHVWGEEECMQDFSGKTRRKETSRKKGLDIGRMVILRWLLEK
jgi:hypothetical protein